MTFPPAAGAVLAGGASRRMGRDKGLIEVGGRPLARIAVEALLGAGLDPVVVVGGTEAHGVALVADSSPGDGPLGAVLDALGASDAERTVILPCDVPWMDVAAVQGLLAADRQGVAAVTLASVEGVAAPPVGVWRRSAAAALAAAFAAGERSLRGALRGIEVTVVELGAAARDVDHPGDLVDAGTLSADVTTTRRPSGSASSTRDERTT